MTNFNLLPHMKDIHVSIQMAAATILNLRKIITAMRSGQGTTPAELEIMLSRAIIDMAGLMDYASSLEEQLENKHEEGNSIQPMG